MKKNAILAFLIETNFGNLTFSPTLGCVVNTVNSIFLGCEFGFPTGQKLWTRSKIYTTQLEFVPIYVINLLLVIKLGTVTPYQK